MSIIVILVILFRLSFGTTCTDPNANSYTISSNSFTNAGFSGGLDGYLIRLGPISGDFYYLIIGDDGSSSGWGFISNSPDFMSPYLSVGS